MKAIQGVGQIPLARSGRGERFAKAMVDEGGRTLIVEAFHEEQQRLAPRWFSRVQMLPGDARGRMADALRMKESSHDSREDALARFAELENEVLAKGWRVK